MIRWILLALCLISLGCHIEHTIEPTPLPTAALSPSPSPVETESALKNRTVSLLLPNGEEVVSLYTLGFRVDRIGRIRMEEPVLKEWAESFAEDYRIDPIEPQAVFVGGKEAFQLFDGVSGSVPDCEKLIQSVQSLDPCRSGQTIQVEFDEIMPEQDISKLRETHSLLATYTTFFTGTKLDRPNRVHNICLAADRINGCIVEPNEVFSINQAILDRTKQNGYKMAGAITNGISVTEYGGGVCQVSTTLFNAVLMSDLEVVERYHHSWPMEYAPVGRDATIATGLKDFRFRNTTDWPITIEAHVDETERSVTVSLYGKHSEAFDHIEVVSEQIKRLPSKQGETFLDASLAPGTRNIERKSRRGRISVTYLDYYGADGTLLRRETAFEDTYPSIGEIAYVSADLYYGTTETNE